MQKIRLEQKLQQKLSPQQIQVIKLLEFTTLELEEKVKQELEENPALEETENSVEEEITSVNEEDTDLGDYRNEDDIPPYKLETNNRLYGEKKEDIPFSAGITFHESLLEQIELRELTEKQLSIAQYIIGNLDDEGYLRRDLGLISDDLIFQVNVDVSFEELEEVLAVIQELDPPGVGARTLQECLLIQLKRQEDEPDPDVEIAKALITDYFNEFAYKHYPKIAKELNLSEERLKSVIQRITMLNPKPGNAFSTPLENRKETIIPDFIVEYFDGKLYVNLNNQNVPELRISTDFSALANNDLDKDKQPKDNDAALFIRQKIDSAKWFIEAIKQRQNTLLSTMRAIVNFQQDFFKEGDESVLKPMILKNIAEKTGFDISTISRVSNSKYVQTNFGVYPLKYFFSESMQTEDGEEISTREIKKIISECIQQENKEKPLTDEQLTELLREKSYLIARRTVAKYREQLNIPVARLRKEI